MKIHWSTALLAGGLIASASSNADMQTQTTEVPLPEFFESAFFEPGQGGEFFNVPVAGVPKFDPSLGTLLDVTISTDLNLDVDLYLESGGILNPGVPHDAGITFTQIVMGIVFENNIANPPVINLLGDIQSGFGTFCMGFPGDGEACSEFDFLPISAGAFEFSLLNFIQLTDFIGVGEYDGFSFEFDLIAPVFDLNNVDFAFADVMAYADAGFNTITITYHYDDGAGVDSDGDGIADAVDNCVNAANPTQFDADGDDYGNACDADTNNDCIVNAIDLGALKAGFFGSNPLLDFNSDGQVNAIDLGILKINFFGVPGPSGLTSSCSN